MTKFSNHETNLHSVDNLLSYESARLKHLLFLAPLLFFVQQLQYYEASISKLFGLLLPLFVCTLLIGIVRRDVLPIFFYYLLLFPLFLEDFPYFVYLIELDFSFSPFNHYFGPLSIGYLSLMSTLLIFFSSKKARKIPYQSLRFLLSLLVFLLFFSSIVCDLLANNGFRLNYYYLLFIFQITGVLRINRIAAVQLFSSLVVLSISFFIATLARLLFLSTSGTAYLNAYSYDSAIRFLLPIIGSTVILQEFLAGKKLESYILLPLCIVSTLLSSSSELILYFSILFISQIIFRIFNKKRFKAMLVLVMFILTIVFLLFGTDSPVIEKSVQEIEDLLIFLSRDLSGSPGFRLIETRNINAELAWTGGFHFLVGLGSKGSFTDREIGFADSQLTQAAFTYDQIRSRRFELPHSLLNEMLLRGGYLGLITVGLFSLYIVLIGIKTGKLVYSVLLLISVFTIYWSIKGLLILFILSITISSFLEYNDY